MITPVHLIFDLGVFSLIYGTGITDTSQTDLLLLLSAELIDLDHFFSKPIYDPKRNSFASHVLHKNWKILLAISVLFVLYRPLLFLGIGLMSHFFLDYCYNKIYKLKQ
ncbi:hypothetical protein BK004_03095 [bacterium CG10_46_32]|nr:MAG: hypothetical protein BK004_03095 [bacterium CG10_46_32]PIR55987.1 MAG: hypothetical protein COU73_03130 [Parcubacteria group bacterium CG10_big_fil_rev_8_21_14_0_10_46_32]